MLRVNGYPVDSVAFTIPENKAHLSFKAYIGMPDYQSQMVSDVRLGGFYNTGHYVELSFDDVLNSGFKDDFLNAYLIKDLSHTGNFPSGMISYFPVDEIDLNRKKMIFKNVFWDNQTADIFKFAYSRDGISKNIRSRSATISNTDDNNVDDNREGQGLNFFGIRNIEPQKIELLMSLKEAEMTTVQLYDIQGKLITRSQFYVETSISTKSIELPGPGVYIVRVNSSTNSYRRKVMAY